MRALFRPRRPPGTSLRHTFPTLVRDACAEEECMPRLALVRPPSADCDAELAATSPMGSDKIIGQDPSDDGYDVLLFVHGYNTSLADAGALLAQLLALARFPATLMPVVFGWPCTGAAFYANVRLLFSDRRLSAHAVTHEAMQRRRLAIQSLPALP